MSVDEATSISVRLTCPSIIGNVSIGDDSTLRTATTVCPGLSSPDVLELGRFFLFPIFFGLTARVFLWN
jgi:hypothetical protein